ERADGVEVRVRQRLYEGVARGRVAQGSRPPAPVVAASVARLTVVTGCSTAAGSGAGAGDAGGSVTAAVAAVGAIRGASGTAVLTAGAALVAAWITLGA